MKAGIGTERHCTRRSIPWPQSRKLRTPIQALWNLQASPPLTGTVEKGSDELREGPFGPFPTLLLTATARGVTTNT